MVVKLILVVSSLLALTLAQQRPVPPAFTRATQGRFATPLELEPNQPVPQPFRRVSLPLYRGRGFSLDGQEPKPAPLLPQQTFQPRPTLASIENNNGDSNRVGNTAQDEKAEVPPQPTRLQAPPFQLADRNQQQQQAEKIQQQQQQQADRAERIQQQQVDRIQQQQQQIDRIQPQPEKPFPSFRPQPQIQPVEKQPHYVRKVVQRPSQKRVQVAEESVVASKTPEMVQRLKLERSESADKQRAKKPVSQVLRRYRDDNPDGSITWGFENDDGTFKEETIGVDCVTRGKYGYVDPEGVKREYSYQSGVPCDKNRQPLTSPAPGQGPQSSAVQEAQASDKSYGYIDYSRNQYVMANGQTIALNGMAKNRARKPVVRKTAVVASGGGAQGNTY